MTGRVVSARATPEQVRLVVAVEGIGDLDAVRPWTATPVRASPCGWPWITPGWP